METYLIISLIALLAVTIYGTYRDQGKMSRLQAQSEGLASKVRELEEDCDRYRTALESRQFTESDMIDFAEWRKANSGYSNSVLIWQMQRFAAATPFDFETLTPKL